MQEFIECKTELSAKFIRKWVILKLEENVLHFASQLEVRYAFIV